MQHCAGEVDHQLTLNFYYKNKSNRIILIKHFDNRDTGNKVVATNMFIIPPQDSTLFLSVQTEGDKDHSVEDFERYFQMNTTIDSVYIDYNKERFQTYTLQVSKPRNVLKMSNFEGEEVSITTFGSFILSLKKISKTLKSYNGPKQLDGVVTQFYRLNKV